MLCPQKNSNHSFGELRVTTQEATGSMHSLASLPDAMLYFGLVLQGMYWGIRFIPNLTANVTDSGIDSCA